MSENSKLMLFRYDESGYDYSIVNKQKNELLEKYYEKERKSHEKLNKYSWLITLSCRLLVLLFFVLIFKMFRKSSKTKRAKMKNLNEKKANDTVKANSTVDIQAIMNYTLSKSEFVLPTDPEEPDENEEDG